MTLVCDAYLETRVLHKSQQPPEAATDRALESPTAHSAAADAQTMDGTSPPIAISEEEQIQLDELMRAEVNDMLNDILRDRRRTCGMDPSEEEEPSDDSFDEKYLPPASIDAQTSASHDENETPVNHTPSDGKAADAERQDRCEERGEKSGDEEAVEKPCEEGKESDDRSEHEQAEEPIREETAGGEEKIDDASATEEDGRSISTPPQATEELPSSASLEDSEEKKSKETKSSGFWCNDLLRVLVLGKSLLVASAVASVIIAKRLAK